MEQVAIHKPSFDFLSSDRFFGVEVAEDFKRATLTIPLIHVGPNKKGLFWTEGMLKELAPMFRGVTFRYDLDGQEGSSHTINKLSSPHFDVGWTYSDDNGAWYDESTHTLWIKGEVTHPQVIEKLERMTTDGHRELNYASMGVIVEKAVCSICGGNFEEICENGHERLKVYNGAVCNKIPVEVTKALHAALTNDPADGEAEIKECVFQEFGYPEKDSFNKEYYDQRRQDAMQNQNSKNFNSFQGVNSPYNKDTEQTSPNELKNSPNSTMAYKNINQGPISTNYSQIPGGLATSSPQTGQPGMAPNPEMILRDLAERIKTVENKLVERSAEPTPELVNSAPQNQFMQDNMGTTTSFEEENKMVPAGQNSQEKVPLNPAPVKDEKMEKAEAMMTAPDPMTRIMEMLEEIMKRLPAVSNVQETPGNIPESADGEGTEEMIAFGKGKVKKEESEPAAKGLGGHMAPGDAASGEDKGNVKNKENMLKPGMVATADSKLENLEKEMIMLKKKLELQDNEVPEYGGSNSTKGLDVADMGADGRAQKFGDYGKWDAIFHGAGSASKFGK
jgi:hypothetical protein